MTAAGAYDIATEHAILVEASESGVLQAIPSAVLFGVLLGAIYGVFRMLAAGLGICDEDAAALGPRMYAALRRLRQFRLRSLRDGGCCDSGDTCEETAVTKRRIPARVGLLLLDLLYFLVCGVLGAVFLYWCNYGILRWYLVICGGIGFYAYNRTVGAAVIRFGMLAAAVLRAVLCTVWNHTLYYPMRAGLLVVQWLVRAVGRMAGACRMRKSRNKKQNREKTPSARSEQNALLWEK